MQQRYLFAAVGNGFRLYDVLAHEGMCHSTCVETIVDVSPWQLDPTTDGRGHPRPLASHSYAHQKPISCIEFLEDRYNNNILSRDSV